MDLMQKLGGRKFLMALVVVGISVFLEMHSEKGLTPTMAGFLVAIIGTFSAANYAATAKDMMTNQKRAGDPSLHEKLDTIQTTVAGTYNKESEAALVKMLSQIDKNMGSIKDTTDQVGMAVVGLHNIIQPSKRS